MNPYPNQKSRGFHLQHRATYNTEQFSRHQRPSPVKLLRERSPDFPPSIDSGLFRNTPHVPHGKRK
ncbi:BZ3500_MvSof-1268-A1-R1_Chr6-3g08809 [Microbotryum saponariae]|uniref:BZ3500_MvSof-1268-A1-R1_Chr6-3g08809 protein n=1 Tax=Microbotryum saponariae TaxID=289078 RepID=A0A2X0LPL5_9BASI|nr:BZ3500_MvSof-1268-A1-R1_Chr6-3g08809 [Microbotryum saponariae]SDA07410.1 BZ3501_MvSof-1269-A2-R1_Chr6-2g08512 [Microbotryum saponariae]